MNPLIIANTQIRQDAAGRYCLNDLHQAAGGAKRHQPANWLRLDQARELIAEVEKSAESEGASSDLRNPPVHQVNDGFANGTYAVKELVYAYAMWISAAFHLHVIRAYDALVTQRVNEVASPLLAMPQHRADQLVSAGRIFSAALRTARQAHMSPARAMQAAFACAQRHTGIDWEQELGVTPGELGALPVPAPCSVASFHAAWANGDAGLPHIPVLTTDLYAAYQAWCSDRDTPAQPLGRFVSALLMVPGGPLVQRKRWRDEACLVGPHSFAMPLMQQHPGAGRSMEVWLGKCVQQFRAAAGGGQVVPA